MPIELKDIKEEDRLDFEKRLANYGLDTSSIVSNELITIASTVTPLHIGNSAQSKFSPVTLKTSDFDQVNKWIGTPDSLAQNADIVIESPKPLRFINQNLRKDGLELSLGDALAKLKVEDLDTEHLTNIRKAAEAYLYGDSTKYKSYKPWIEKLFPIIDITIWPFLNVTVKSGSVLEFGPGAHVLTAYNLTIEEGGLIRCHGHLKVDAVIVQKSKPIKFFEIDPALLNTTVRAFRQQI